MAYKFSSPYYWLMFHVDRIISQVKENLESGDPDGVLDATDQLRSIIRNLGIMYNSDTIQDLHQYEMDKDGYFTELSE